MKRKKGRKGYKTGDAKECVREKKEKMDYFRSIGVF